MSSHCISNRPTFAACTNSSIPSVSSRPLAVAYWIGLTRKRSQSPAVRIKRSRPERICGAQLAIDPSSVRRCLRRLSLTRDDSFISVCYLAPSQKCYTAIGQAIRLATRQSDADPFSRDGVSRIEKQVRDLLSCLVITENAERCPYLALFG